MTPVYLYLEDGSSVEGTSFGATPKEEVFGEIVFNTSMTGYQEILSDPSYCDQMIVMTYPLIGNYGINRADFECLTPHLKAMIVKVPCHVPSHYREQRSLDRLFKDFDICGVGGVDTRYLVKRIRSNGDMKAILTSTPMGESDLKTIFSKSLASDQIARVSTKAPIHYPGHKDRVVVMDFGMKKSILTSLTRRGMDVIVVPYNTSFQTIMNYAPDGVMLSNGPGNPESIQDVCETVRELQKHVPMFSICMGHQIFAMANGAGTEKMKFGHRGANHPVYNKDSGRTHITSQNHGYTVKRDGLEKTDLELTEWNLNDDTIEGLRHKELNSFSVQYHPEANPGPRDTDDLFDKFIQNIQDNKRKLCQSNLTLNAF